MTAPILLCCDLDRTLIPNGPQPGSADAPTRFARVAARPEVTLVYVTGRSRPMVEDAIRRWGLPRPDVAATDVGSAIHDVGPASAWTPWKDWRDRIADDWRGIGPRDIAAALADIEALSPQAADRQASLKLSFTAPHDADATALTAAVQTRLSALGIAAEAIWSIDETVPLGLLDIVPKSAAKLGAIDFIRQRLGFSPERTLFAGDSGNDLPVLTGPFRAVLVANATEDVRREAVRRAANDRLHLARGGLFGMNGAYAAGILEGLAHFFPETALWMEQSDTSIFI